MTEFSPATAYLFDNPPSRIKRYFDVFRLGLTLCILVWGILISSYLILHHGCSACDTVIAPVNHVAHYVLLVNIILLIPCAVFWVNWRALLFLMPGVIFFGLWFGQSWLPRSTPEVEGIEVRVATFNVLGHDADPHRTFSIIQDLDADIIGLQEMHPYLARTLRRNLGDDYQYQAARTLVDEDEFVLLSRYPITGVNFYQAGRDEDSGQFIPNHMRAVVDIEGQAVVVYVFHPPNPNFNQIVGFDDSDLETEVETMVGLVEQRDSPVIILCDCNSTPRSRQYRELDNVLDNAFGEAGTGFGLTYPAARPIIRIDHIWFSDEFSALEAEVLDISGTSDHRPVWASLDFHP